MPAAHTATSRVARYLLAKLPAEHCAMELDVRKGILASRPSIKLETFSRVEKSLRDQCIFEVDRSHVSVLDQAALEALAELGDSFELDPLPCARGERGKGR